LLELSHSFLSSGINLIFSLVFIYEYRKYAILLWALGLFAKNYALKNLLLYILYKLREFKPRFKPNPPHSVWAPLLILFESMTILW